MLIEIGFLTTEGTEEYTERGPDPVLRGVFLRVLFSVSSVPTVKIDQIGRGLRQPSSSGG
jgi:hypothetical protein